VAIFRPLVTASMTLMCGRRPTHSSFAEGDFMRHRLVLVFALFTLVALAAAQQGAPVEVHVGDSMVNGGVLKPYKNQWQVSVTTPAGKENPDAALWTDQLEFVKIDGHQCLQRTQIATFKKDGAVIVKNTTVNVFNPKTMAPISRSFTSHLEKTGADDSTHIEFHDRELHFEHTGDNKIDTQDVKLDAPAFDFYGGLYGLLLSALPLKTGFFATLPSIDEDAPTVSSVTFKVTGEDSVDAGPQGKVKAWVVEADSSLGPMKFWLSKDAPYIIRLEYTAKDNGYIWKYQMV
jgi:hypothetical protein